MHKSVQIVSGALSQNAVITGLSVVGISSVVGLVVASVRNLLKYIKERFLVSVEVFHNDDCYAWVLEWLSEQPEMALSRSLSVETSYTKEDHKPIVSLVPSLGYHWMIYNNHHVWIRRNRENTFDMASGRMFESLTITVRARQGGQKLLRDLINEALKKGMQKDEGKTLVFTNSSGSWQKFAARTKRPWASVILPAGVKENLLEDAKRFLSSDSWYRDRGIPFRRGYLLYGIPGSGKSSLVHALAGLLDLNICIVSLAQNDINDQILLSLLNEAPPNVLLLIEDIDAAFTQRDGDRANGVTFAGLLNALDGVAAQEGRILFMTTNRLQSLDPALIREGRVDKRVHLGHATQEQAGSLYAHFYSLPRDSALTRQFEYKIPDGKVTMAELQGYFMTYRSSAETAFANVDDLLQRSSQHN